MIPISFKGEVARTCAVISNARGDELLMCIGATDRDHEKLREMIERSAYARLDDMTWDIPIDGYDVNLGRKSVTVRVSSIQFFAQPSDISNSERFKDQSADRFIAGAESI